MPNLNVCTLDKLDELTRERGQVKAMLKNFPSSGPWVCEDVLVFDSLCLIKS